MQETDKSICTLSSLIRLLATAALPSFPSSSSYQAADCLHLRLELPSEREKSHTQLSFLDTNRKRKLHQTHFVSSLFKPSSSFSIGCDKTAAHPPLKSQIIALYRGGFSLVFPMVSYNQLV